jgi:hypothetical protein
VSHPRQAAPSGRAFVDGHQRSSQKGLRKNKGYDENCAEYTPQHSFLRKSPHVHLSPLI